MARHPYHVARQQHLGDALDDLKARGKLDWRWDYADRRAIFRIQMTGSDWIARDTRAAEQLVQAEYDKTGIRWKAVAHPGGEDQLAETLAWINAHGVSWTRLARPCAARNIARSAAEQNAPRAVGQDVGAPS